MSRAGEFLTAAVALLDRLVSDKASSTDARAALEELRARHGEYRLELFDRKLEIDGSLEFELLVNGLGRAALTLAVSNPKAAPWPLRGYQRWTNDQLGRVDGVAIMVSDALVSLECLGEDIDLIRRLVDMAIVKRELLFRPVEPTGAQLQEAADALRRRLRLYTAEATRAWLAQRGLGDSAFATQAREAALLQLLRRRLVGAAVDDFFAEQRELFARAALTVVTASATVAARAAELARAGTPLYLAAREAAGATDVTVELVASKRVFQLEPAIVVAIRGARPGDLVGPIELRGKSSVIEITSLVPARLDEETRSAVEDALFARWLAERRAAASIEWYWGNERLVSRIRTAYAGPYNIWMTRPDRRDPLG